MPDRTSATNTDSSIENFRQRVIFQHTVNANELCTKALPGLCGFKICTACGSRY